MHELNPAFISFYNTLKNLESDNFKDLIPKKKRLFFFVKKFEIDFCHLEQELEKNSFVCVNLFEKSVTYKYM